jgi:hypothetical protein
MNVAKSLSFLDMVLLMGPIVAFMLLALLRMDEGMSAGRSRVRPRRRFCQVGPDGHGLLLDPDGQPENRIGFKLAGRKRRRKTVLEPASVLVGRHEYLNRKSTYIIEI